MTRKSVYDTQTLLLWSFAALNPLNYVRPESGRGRVDSSTPVHYIEDGYRYCRSCAESGILRSVPFRSVLR